MKNAIRNIEGLVMFLLGLTLTACANEEVINSEEGRTYEVPVSLIGEYDANLFSRSNTTQRYFGIEVYAKGEEREYSRYAHGLFSDVDNLIISLIPGKQYRFECMMVEDGIDSVDLSGTYPFNSQKVCNQFVYGGDYGFNLSHPFVSQSTDPVEDGISCYIEKPCLTMMYGALDDYVCQANGQVTIPMYRIGYGLKVNVDNVPEGELSVIPEEKSILHIGDMTGERSWDMSFSEAGTVQHIFANGLFTINDYPEDWKERISTFTKTSSVSFFWIHDDGSIEEFSKKVTFKRNVTSVLNVDLSMESSIKFELEDTDMEVEIETIIFKAKEWEESLMDVDL